MCPISCHFRGDAHRLQVDVHRVLNASSIATGHQHSNGQSCIPAEFQHESIPLGEAWLRQGQAA
jgi:hypothetical protein